MSEAKDTLLRRFALLHLMPFERPRIATSTLLKKLKSGTDNIQVSRPVVDYNRFCTVYGDNFTLSATCARKARKLLVQALDEQRSSADRRATRQKSRR